MKKHSFSKLCSYFAAVALTVMALFAPSKQIFAGGDTSSKASRIVSVGGSVTEVVYALGEQDRLIARDTTSVFPDQVNDLPNVGYIRALSPEGVLSVDPDLILMLEGGGPPEAVEVLNSSGISIAMIPEEFTAAGIVGKVQAVGKALGVPEKADALSLKISADLEAAQVSASGKASGMRVLFILSTRGGRIMAGGVDTEADGILSLVGAVNAVSDFTGYKQLSDEAIISAAPDVVLMMTRAGDHGAGPEELFGHPALAQTPAAENNRLIRMRGQYLLGFGPRTADAIRELSQKLADYRN
ncbi:ABC transporter substrate-binding protein [Roseibium porphyridii]|uniref:ABC transporter substrate-binding protein n=1 Tax=Roseibium porphyridii TaxID=2866279 RepID=A0ABY8F703_9HYPH|nr:ABC transporter substrate-binding protein [Roseibium sp. KMA01]WFE91011.1 ABC transporter substrate-binding protein [Roseibium sp. KMA01]